LSLIQRKKYLFIGSFLVLVASNFFLFQSEIKKELFLKKYTSLLPSYSNQDIFVLSKENSDILHPKPFSFPYVSNIQSHEDVLGVTALASEGEEFYKTYQDPQLLVVSLKKGASTKKWMDTFDANPDYVALSPGQYKMLYKRALLSTNESLYLYSSLLSTLSLFSFIALVFSTSLFPIILQKEVKTLLLEGAGALNLLFSTTAAFSVIVSMISIGVAFCNWTQGYPFEIIGPLLLHILTAEMLTVFLISAGIVLIARSCFGKYRIQ